MRAYTEKTHRLSVTFANFVDFTMADLTRAEMATWLVLYRDSKYGTAATSMRNIAPRAGCGLKFVAAAVKHLEGLGLLKVVRKGGYWRGSSCYRVRGLVPLE
jgi:hypothetical protein